jgi:hypothetical protein
MMERLDRFLVNEEWIEENFSMDSLIHQGALCTGPSP